MYYQLQVYIGKNSPADDAKQIMHHDLLWTPQWELTFSAISWKVCSAEVHIKPPTMECIGSENIDDQFG